ncbi:MAG: glycosyltransferase family 2 protein [Beijerinckiaceae bacterium]
MDSRLPISAFFIAFNEADRLPQALRPVLGLCAEVIVIDSGSTDGTREIAAAMGARVFTNAPFPGYGAQKRFGEDRCSHRWILNLDADEELSDTAVAHIRALFAAGEPAFDGVRMPITEMFPGEAKPHRFAYAVKKVRLYAKDRGRFDASPVFDDVRMAEGAHIASIRGVVMHRSIRSLGDQLRKLDSYTDKQVADMVARGRRLPRWRLFVEFPVSFLNAYFIRRHCVRGVYGFLTAMNYAWFRYMRAAKFTEHELLQRTDADA